MVYVTLLLCWFYFDTYLSIVADYVHPVMETVFPDGTIKAQPHNKNGSGVVWGQRQWVWVELNRCKLRLQIQSSMGCSGQTNAIHGGPTSKLKGSVALL